MKDSRRDHWEAAFHSQEVFFFVISVETCRQIEGKKIFQILNFHSLGNFISFRQITQTVAVAWTALGCGQQKAGPGLSTAGNRAEADRPGRGPDP